MPPTRDGVAPDGVTNPMQLNLDQVVSHLQKVRADHGDEHYHAALKGLFRDLISKDGGSQYIALLLEKLGETDFDLDGLKSELLGAERKGVASKPTETPLSVIEQAIRQGMPHCKTKAHFDLVIQASEALRVYLDAAFALDGTTASKAREGLTKLLDLAPQLAEVAQKLEDHPEATTNRDFIDPPPEASEVSRQQALLAELAPITERSVLDHWYSLSKERMNGVVSQRLRDELFDAIRAKKHALSN